MIETTKRVLLAAAGLLGALGVMSAAMASHSMEARNLAAISAMALAHAPVLLALALAGRGRVHMVAGAVLVVGCTLFIGDLAMREWQAVALFPGAAPLGGGALLLGWIVIAISALVRN
ncbi:Uncharacterized membrane protein YgdD, TMEM256/DUF423 family [Devosia crocina]|uniref:Uncharacterized membrane protein YgdD, TMEM256/DUF423 family n=1 Tax=Devosia crocina TaxID=429728 RepID=A0A1I7N793_9HYPH|nr:DUF423 domain-containing protein [Devosia crocina]SFV30538.1 Uncharacterized membrane protein YgdD, TMEM256/DUF423 family [Devosia crocina]